MQLVPAHSNIVSFADFTTQARDVHGPDAPVTLQVGAHLAHVT